MAHVLISLGGDDGHDLNQVTVNSADARKNKVYVDADGNTQNGAMLDIVGRAITPGANQQTIDGGGYLTRNTTVLGFSLPTTSIIKKGVTVTIYGRKVTGTFQGWMGDAGDLYIDGQSNAGSTIYGSTFQRDRIILSSGSTLTSTKPYTLTRGQKLTVVGGSINGSFDAGQSGRRCFYLEDDAGALLTQIGMSTISYANGFSSTMPKSLIFKPKVRSDYTAFSWPGYIGRIYI